MNYDKNIFVTIKIFHSQAIIYVTLIYLNIIYNLIFCNILI